MIAVALLLACTPPADPFGKPDIPDVPPVGGTDDTDSGLLAETGTAPFRLTGEWVGHCLNKLSYSRYGFNAALQLGLTEDDDGAIAGDGIMDAYYSYASSSYGYSFAVEVTGQRTDEDVELTLIDGYSTYRDPIAFVGTVDLESAVITGTMLQAECQLLPR